ncbi:MAG: hypothetical protein ACU0A6_07630 [Shimia sp.]|uniref:hypothetical protein n=1 Tax=Shimia sp. TaxID=1954381 RepID=UPI00405A01D0
MGVLAVVASTAMNAFDQRDAAQERILSIERIGSETEALQIEFLMARRDEKDFLLRKMAKYVDRHTASMDNMDQGFHVLSEHLNELPEMADAVVACQNYRSTFKNTALYLALL